MTNEGKSPSGRYIVVPRRKKLFDEPDLSMAYVIDTQKKTIVETFTETHFGKRWHDRANALATRLNRRHSDAGDFSQE